MKRILTAMAAVLILTGSSQAGTSLGSAFGFLSTAHSIGMGNGYLGFGVGIADATSFIGSVKYGLANYLDGRIKLGLVDPDYGDAKLTFGADVMYQLLDAGKASNPFDLGLGGFFEYADYGSSVVQIGGAVSGSRDFIMTNNQTITPYARFDARLESFNDDSNLEIGLITGVQWGITQTVKAYGEFQLDGNDGLFLGMEFAVF